MTGLIVKLDRGEARNAVDGPTAQSLADAFRAFEHGLETLDAGEWPTGMVRFASGAGRHGERG